MYPKNRSAVELIHSGRWVSLDTETTGLGPRDEILEIAVIAANGKVLVETLVKPRRAFGAQAIHKITQDDLETAPTWPRVWPAIEGLFHGKAVVAWNAAFDLRMIRQTCALYAQPFSLRAPFVELRALLEPEAPRSLAKLCQTYALAHEPTHRARPDAEAVRLILCQRQSQIAEEKDRPKSGS